MSRGEKQVPRAGSSGRVVCEMSTLIHPDRDGLAAHSPLFSEPIQEACRLFSPELEAPPRSFLSTF